ncbi:MAG: Ig-like domain-containing protein, partial [Pseudomonadota bacterium]
MLSAFGKIFKSKKQQVSAPQADKPLMRALEPRVLLDAAAMETARDMAASATHADLADAHMAAQADNISDDMPTEGHVPARDLSRDVVFIDGNVTDIGALLSELDPDVEVHILDLQSDGVEQIADLLDGRSDIAAVHIFSHGGQGFLNLGSSQLSSDTISTSHVEALTRIGASLAEGGDILIYGCDFGAGETGRAVAAQLAAVTGADIAASDDLTGSADQGGDWDLEVEAGQIETRAFAALGYGHTLDAFELGSNDAPVVTLADTRTLTPTGLGTITAGGVGSTATWENAGIVTFNDGSTAAVDVRATVDSVSNALTGVGFGIRSDGTGDVDDFRIIIYNDNNPTADTNDNPQVLDEGVVQITWEIFLAGTNTKASFGEVGLTISDIDGRDGVVATREALGAETGDLSSYTVQAGTNLVDTNTSGFIFVDGTQDQNDEESSWVRFNWNSVNELTMQYRTHTPQAFYHHDGDGDLVFTNPNTSFATGIDLDADDSSGATGSSYQTIYFSPSTGTGTPVEIADADISVNNTGNRQTSATIVLTNALAGDVLEVNQPILNAIGLTSTTDTSVPGQITITLTGDASSVDYQTAIQTITYRSTVNGSAIDLTPRSIDVEVFDNSFSSGVANTAITFGTVINQPTAIRDLYIADEDTMLSVATAAGVLANDSDPQNGALTLSAATTSAGAPITVNAVGAVAPVSTTLPSGGVLTLFDDGSFTYDPANDFSGVDYFNYTTMDTGGFTADSFASINVRGIADTPSVPASPTSTVSNEDLATNPINITSVETDGDGSETLVYSVTNIPVGLTLTDGINTFTSATPADTVDVSEWDLTNIFLTRPGVDSHSDQDLVLQLSVSSVEPNGSTATVVRDLIYNVAAVADAPNLTGTNGNTGVDVPVRLAPLVNASLVDTDGSEEIVSYTLSNIPSGYQVLNDGTPLTITGGSTTFSAADLADITIETTTGFTGTYTFDIIATSQETNPQDDVAVATADSAVVTISVTTDTADDPVTAGDDTANTNPGTPVTLSVLNNDGVPDGGATITQINGANIAVGTPVNLPSGNGTVVVNANGSITFTPTALYSGGETFSYTVADLDGDTDVADVTVTLNPQWTLTGATTVAEGNAVDYVLSLVGDMVAGQQASVTLDITDIDTTAADYSSLNAVLADLAASRTDLSFDGTQLTYTRPADADYVTVTESNPSAFVDISGSGTALGAADESVTSRSIGFTFDFFGTSYTDLFVGGNGFLVFSSDPGGNFNNTDMSAGTAFGGRPAIAPFWEDLDATVAGEVYVETVGTAGNREFIVQWDEIARWNNGATQTITFQAVLSEADGSIEFRYEDATFGNAAIDGGAGATIGIQDGSGTGIEFSQNTNSVSDGDVIRFEAGSISAPVFNLSIAAIDDVGFEPDEDFRLELTGSTGSGIDNALDDVTTTITDTNTAPVLTVPDTSGGPIATTTTPEDTALVFAASNGNAISVADPDFVGSLDVTVTVTNGTMLASLGSGATLTGSGTDTLTISGTQAQVNAALNGLRYFNTPDYNGTATLTVSVDDNTGTGNATDSETIEIQVTPVVDVADDWAEVGDTGSVTIPVLANDSPEGAVTNIAVAGASNGTVTVNPDNTVTYTWTTPGPGGGFDTFTYTITSGGVTETADVIVVKHPIPQPDDDTGSTTEDLVLTVPANGVLANDTTVSTTPTLDYTTITTAGATGTWAGGATDQNFDWTTGVTHNTAPTTTLPGITESLTFSGSSDAAADSFDGLSGNPTDSDATLEMWFKYDPDDYTSGQGAILFESGGGTDGISIALSDSTGGGTGTIDHLRLHLRDGGTGGANAILLADLSDVVGPGNIANEFFQVTAVYDRNSGTGTPSDDRVMLYINGILVQTVEIAGLEDWSGGDGAGLGGSNGGTNITDASEFGDFQGEIAQFKFYETALNAIEVKDTFDAVAGLTVTAETITTAQGATVTIAADGSYTYDPSSVTGIQAMQAGDTLTDSFDYTVTDANGVTNDATVTITVTGVNDAPTGSDSTVTLDEDTSHTLTVANFGFDDPVDGTNDNFDEVVFTTVPANGSLIYNNGGGDTTLVDGATVSAADIAAGFLRFVPVANENNTSTPGGTYTSFTFQVRDDGGTANGGVDLDPTPNTLTFSVNPVNDVTAITVPGAQSTLEDTALAIGGVSVADIDGGSLTTTVSLPAASGTVSVAAGGGAIITDNGSATVTISGTIAQVNTALAGLSYTPVADYNTGAGTFDITVSTNDGSTTESETIAVSVNPVADIVADTIAVAEGGTIEIDAIAGTNGASADNFENSGAAVTSVDNSANTGNIDVTVLPSGEIRVTALGDYFGTATFDYTVTSGGVTETSTVTVNVSNVNDAPVAVDDSNSGNEDAGDVTGNVITDPLTGDSDIDSGLITVTEFSVAGFPGTTAAGSPFAIPGVGTITIETNGDYTFAPAANYTGTVPAITYEISDGALTDDAELTITINPVNDAPAATNDGPIVLAPTVPQEIDVLDNDTDLDGDTISVNAIEDPDNSGSFLSITVGSPVTLPSGTVVALLANGNLQVTQPHGAAEVETFTYRITDGALTDTATVTLHTDFDADGIADIVDIDDDNDGIIDLVEQGVLGAADSGIDGAIPAGDVSFEITSADFSDQDGDHVLEAVIIDGKRLPVFLLPDSYSYSFAAGLSQDATFRQDGSDVASLSGSGASWETDILPAFQSRDLNDYQVLGTGGPNWTAGDYFEVGYDEPVLVSDGAFVGFSERGGNNGVQLQAFDENGVALSGP